MGQKKTKLKLFILIYCPLPAKAVTSTQTTTTTTKHKNVLTTTTATVTRMIDNNDAKIPRLKNGETYGNDESEIGFPLRQFCELPFDTLKTIWSVKMQTNKMTPFPLFV